MSSDLDLICTVDFFFLMQYFEISFFLDINAFNYILLFFTLKIIFLFEELFSVILTFVMASNKKINKIIKCVLNDF
jgi:hypothetical protein